MLRKTGIALVTAGIVESLVFSMDLKSKDLEDRTEMYTPISIQTEYTSTSNLKTQIADILAKKGDAIHSVEKTLTSDPMNQLHQTFEVNTTDEDSIAPEVMDELLDETYVVAVKMTDTQAPIIDGGNATITQGSNFDISALNIQAKDVVDGSLDHKIISNNVDINIPGSYAVVATAVDSNGLSTQRSFTVTVEEKVIETSPTPINTNTSGYNNNNNGGGRVQTYTPPTVQALDRNNLSVRGWKIVANDASVSDATIQSYMNELASLPYQYDTRLFQTVYIDRSLPYPYLGMAYSDGKLVLNGEAYYATTILHEATHAYDFVRGFNADPALIQARNQELNNLPVEFSGNMKDDTYEWVANIVVFYYYDRATLQNAAPQSYNYVVNNILR